MDRDDIIRKIKRCMALSASAEPHEAAAAMRQAQKLSEQLGIDQDELQLSDVHESRSPVGAVKVQRWQALLAEVVAEAFGCGLFLSTGTKIDPDTCLPEFTSHIVFVGVTPDDEICAYAMDVLMRQCKAQRKAHVKAQPKNCKDATKKARGDAFAWGWVRGVQALVQRMGAREAQTTLIRKYLERKHPHMGEVSLSAPKRKARPQDYTAGHQAGAKAQLHHAVSRGARPLLIGGPR